MKMNLKRFLAMLTAFVMVLGMLPAGVPTAHAADLPFTATVGGEVMTDIVQDELTWVDWDYNELVLTRYCVSVPQDAKEATLTFDSEKQWSYYDSKGQYVGAGESSWTPSTTHTVAIQDSNSDGELDGISVQDPEAFSTEYFIQFVYASPDGGETPDPTQCLNVLSDAPTTGTTTAGALYELELSKVFSETQGHEVSYSFESTVENQHTKIVDGYFCFATSIPGTYDVKLTATCGEVTVTHTLTITVEEAGEGIAAQYGYDETAKASVTVYVTLSNDGYPITAVDGTVMANLEVTVPYFDLGLYGLEDYYRYGTDNNKGPYTSSAVVQRPTGLHLYIYLLERYYMGLDESKCCLGTSGVLEYAGATEIYYMDGELAYESEGKRGLLTSGGATSIYMVNFWGHDENLMYFRNHCYPLMSAGWGSTSDYILLSDGDAWDVGMFTNWSFNRNGKYASFDKNVYNAEPGASVSVSTRSWGTTASAVDFEAMTGLNIGLYNSEWELVQELSYTSGNTITFTAPETAGTYYLLGLANEIKDDSANTAPAAARVVVGSAGSDEPVAVSRILLNTYETTVVYNKEESKSVQLTASVLPAEATDWTITWTSSNEEVATVDQTGLATGISEGETVITAAIGDIKAECTVKVEKFNSAPTVVAGTPERAKVKTGEAVELDIASLFTDAEGDALTFSVEVCEASGLTGSWDYAYTAIEGFDTTVTDGKYSVTFPETGIYALNLTASDGKLSTTHTYQLTVVANDSGVIKLNDGVTIDIWNVVVVDSSEEFVEDYEIPYKGTHDTTIHNIVLSKDTVDGTPNRKMDVIAAEGYGWEQYAYGQPTQETAFSTRADIGLFAYDAQGVMTAHYLQFHTECETHTDENKDAICDVCTLDFSCDTCVDENKDKSCDVCGKWLNNVPTLIEGVENLTVSIQTGLSYQLDDLMNGKIFEDIDGDSLTYESYTYRKSSDGGETWGEWTGFEDMHGTVNSMLSNSTEGTYTYEFRAYDGYGYSEDLWYLTLVVMDVVPADVSFYVGRDQNYATHSTYPVLELYKTAGIDENLYDYVGWFEKDGKTVYVYNPAEYTIIDGETDYVVIEEVQYELHDYEKIAFTNSAFDASDETAAASGTLVGDYNMFYATIQTGRYSTRAYGWNAETSAYDIYLGGQSMELPMEKDIYGGGGGDIYLRVVSVYSSSRKIDNTYFTADDYYAEMIMPITGSMIHSGDAYVSGNYTYFPFMSYAAGNASLYNVYAYPYDTENYIFNQSINNTTSAGYTVVNKSISISSAIALTVTVPQTAEFDLYFQYNNFHTEVVEPSAEAVVNEDGTKTLSFKVTKNNQNYTWRMTDTTGKYVTRAGWLAGLTAATEKTYTFSETSPTDKKTHSFRGLGTAVATRDEGDLQVFLAPSGFMSVSDTYRVRAYRMWEIINSDPGNIMIEPDFHIQVLQGNASDISTVNGGNAVGNWIDVNPTTTDIIAVNYDALDVYSTADAAGSHGGLFPATNPERTGVFVITNETAGTADAVVMFNGGTDTNRGDTWDYNYDTWYYLNTTEKPTLDFTVTGTGTVSVSYATVITDASLKSTLSGWTSLTADAEGEYHADMLPFRNAGALGGTVIIKMTDATGTSYRLVRVAEMTATLTNVTTPGEPFTPGDQVSITFDGLYRTVNKVAGIFNPMTYYLRYTAGDTQVNGSLPQYQQMDNTSITLSIPTDLELGEGGTAEYTFANGHIYGSMLAASNPFSTLYEMTDTGVGTNFSAVGVTFVLSRLADITIEVEQKTYYDVKLVISDGENPITDYTLTITDADGNVMTPDENGIYQDVAYGVYGFTFAKQGYVGQNGTLRIGAADKNSVVDGILTKTITVVKAAENAWDGSTVTEPKTDENGVYLIGTGAELAWFAQTVNAGTTNIKGILTADIDLACYNWTPIGNSSNKFAGTLDGQNHKIYNMTIRNSAATTGVGYGLIGYMNGGKVENLTVDGEITLTNSSSVSNGYVGGVVGACSGAVTLTNVHSNVDITITRVKGNWARVGGLVGNGGSNITITNCSNTGNIRGYQYVGGIVGYASGGSISGCYNAGEVSGNQYIGGIVGSGAPVNIVSCYNTASVTASSTYAGGIVASNTSGKLTNCFNTGAVSASNYAGGVAGRISKADAVVSDIYYLEGVCGTGIGQVTGEHTATAVSAETLASMEFVTTINTGLETPAYKWGGDHPILVWQPDVVIPDPVVAIAVTPEAILAGETVTVTLTLDSAIDNVALAEFFIHYDTSLFTRGEATVGEAVPGTTVSAKNVAVDGTELKNDGTDAPVQKFSVNTYNYPDGAAATAGTIVTVSFTAKAYIPADASAEFKAEFGMMQDKDFTDIAVDVSDPITVTVTAVPCTHDWTEATCTEPKTCSVCGETEGEALGHTWTDATCTEPKTCSVCGETEGEALGHDYVDGQCSRCGEADPDFVVPTLEGVSRIYGDNRVDTAFGIANQLKETLGVEKFDTIVVAYGWDFPDALTGSYLAAVKDAPILLTHKLHHARVIDYIRKNLASDGKVYILGGTGAVDEVFEDYLAEYGIAYKRLGGDTRYETNLLILEEAGVGADQEILVCTSQNFADSLSASAAGLPILLVYRSLTDAQKEFLATSSGKFTIIGGTGAVSESLEEELKAFGTVTRLAGDTRYDTSVMVAKRFVTDPDGVVLAYGINFPDGLCGGPLAVALNAPLVLATDYWCTAADAYVEGMDAGVAVGGTGLISDETVREIFDLAEDAVIAEKKR